MSITTALVKFISNSIVRNFVSPFLPGAHVTAVSVAGGTLYGVQHPGDRNVSKYQKIIWNQAETNTQIFELASTLGPEVVVTDADEENQLRWVMTVDGVPLLRVDGDTEPGAGEWCIAAGGGNGIAEADIQADDSYLAGVSSIAIRHTAMGTGTETIKLGDIIVIGSNNYTVTQDDFAFNNDTGVSISFYPALLTAVTEDDAITFAAATGRTVILGEDLEDNDEVEIYAMDASDVEETTLVAGEEYDTEVRTFLFSPDAITLAKK